MQRIAFYWGIGGVIAILFFAIFRLTPRILELQTFSLGPGHWLSLVLFTGYMVYAEGYRGFHRAFAPRVVARARYLRTAHPGLLLMFAPLFCMGYIHASRKRMLVSYGVTTGIIVLVLLLRITPQPWRGIVDTGVVAGLGVGIASILFFCVQVETGNWRHPIALDLPESVGEPRATGKQEISQAEPP